MKGLNLREINNINNILITWLVRNGFELIVDLDTDFAYYYKDSLITYALALPDKSSRLFTSFCNNLEPDLDEDIFILSFCHELGHALSYENIDDHTYNECRAEKNRISAALAEGTENEDVLINQYFTLHDELTATMCGLDYLKKHRESFKELWSELLPHIQQFYKDNDVEL